MTGLPYPADRKTRPSYLREITRNGQAGAPPRLVTSSTWGPPPPCKQALSLFLREDGLIVRIFNFEQLFNNLLLLNQNKRITFLSRSKETHSLKSLSVINVVFGFFFTDVRILPPVPRRSSRSNHVREVRRLSHPNWQSRLLRHGLERCWKTQKMSTSI